MSRGGFWLLTSARAALVYLPVEDLDPWFKRKAEFTLFAAATARSIEFTINGISTTIGPVPLNILARLIELGRPALPAELGDRPGVTPHAISQNVRRLRDLLAPYPDIIVSPSGRGYLWSPPTGLTHCFILPSTFRHVNRPAAAVVVSLGPGCLDVEPKQARLVDVFYDAVNWPVMIDVDMVIGRGREDIVHRLTMTVEEVAAGSSSDHPVFSATNLEDGWQGPFLLPGQAFPSPDFSSWTICFVIPRSIEPTVVTLRMRFVGGEEIAIEFLVKKVVMPPFGREMPPDP